MLQLKYLCFCSLWENAKHQRIKVLYGLARGVAYFFLSFSFSSASNFLRARSIQSPKSMLVTRDTKSGALLLDYDTDETNGEENNIKWLISPQSLTQCIYILVHMYICISILPTSYSLQSFNTALGTVPYYSSFRGRRAWKDGKSRHEPVLRRAKNKHLSLNQSVHIVL